MNWKQIQIVKVPDFDSRYCKSVNYANDYPTFAENLAALRVKTAYSCLRQNQSTLLFVDKNDVVHYVVLPHGWGNIEDIDKGIRAGFTQNEAREYYHAIESGFSKSEQYKEFSQSGFSDKKIWRKMKLRGFRNNNEYVLAEKMGCPTMEKYREVIESGFPNKAIAEDAARKGLKTVSDLLISKTLEEMPDNMAIGLKDISQRFSRNLQAFRGEHSEYYGRGIGATFLEEIPQIQDLLQSNITSKFGKYSQELSLFAKGESQFKFETEWKTAIMDGPNVAKYPDGEGKLERVIAVKKKLVERNLKCIISASSAMTHWIDEKKTYRKMVKHGDIIQSPSKKDDDFFAISMALEENAYIVTNDGLDNYKEANPKYAEEIDKRRVTFTIRDGNKVMFDEKLSSLKSPTN